MGNKKGLLSIFGALCFLTGIILVTAVLLTWLLAPQFVPQEYGRSSINQLNDAELAALGNAPALAPYTPPSPAGTNDPPLLPGTSTSGNALPPVTNTFSGANDTGWAGVPDDMPNSWKLVHPQADGEELRMAIPAIGVDAPILPVSLQPAAAAGRTSAQQWAVPDQYAAGWHATSAPPGQPGNTVINGHNNIHGAIFHDLVDLPLGAEIILYDAGQSFTYQVTDREFLLERGEPLRSRLRNARWIMPTEDERITIVTCWPNTSNSHRLVVIARPVESS
jgi:LPXTG-site transpeptidase (sortase) family protein